MELASLPLSSPLQIRFVALKNAWANKGDANSFRCICTCQAVACDAQLLHLFRLYEDPFFSALEMHPCMHFAVNMRLVHFEPYSVLFYQDQGCLDFYLVVKGPAYARCFPTLLYVLIVSCAGLMGFCRRDDEGECVAAPSFSIVFFPV